mgnify:CR=1 FL=1
MPVAGRASHRAGFADVRAFSRGHAGVDVTLDRGRIGKGVNGLTRHANIECHEIAAGMSPDASYQIEPDRQSAIKLALASAQPGDLVLIAGKGHETVQIIGSEHRQYDERAYLRQLVTEMSL